MFIPEEQQNIFKGEEEIHNWFTTRVSQFNSLISWLIYKELCSYKHLCSTVRFATSSSNHLHLPGQTAQRWIKWLDSSSKSQIQNEVVVVGTFIIVEILEFYFCSSLPSAVLNGDAELGPAMRKPTAALRWYNFCVISASWPRKLFLLSDAVWHSSLISHYFHSLSLGCFAQSCF